MNKINAIGIVAEYNPFHNGHLLHLKKIKAQFPHTPIIAIMSGNFTQRGEAAIIDKWQRAKTAVANGIDLVIELPITFTCRSAEHFARGAVLSLAATNCITMISFGCEAENFALIDKASQLQLSSAQLKTTMAAGFSYHEAITKLLATELQDSSQIFSQPNNILALEYMRQIHKYNLPLQPLPILRTGANYNDRIITSAIASASAIRQEYATYGCTDKLAATIPSTTLQLLTENKDRAQEPSSPIILNAILSYTLQQATATTIKLNCEVSEGLENRILKASNCRTYEDILTTIKSKRYPETRIKRLLLQLILSTPELSFVAATTELPQYLRILAFNSTGRELLRAMKEKSTLPIITKLGKNILNAKENGNAFNRALTLDINATNLYSLLKTSYLGYNADYKTSPIYLETSL